MRNIDRILNNEDVEHKDDVRELKASIPMLKRYSDREVEVLYGEYSDTFCAGWMILDESYVRGFKMWLETE